MFEFTFETNLLSEDLSMHFNEDDIDFPVALVSYAKKSHGFQICQGYTASLIRRMMNSLLFGII